MKYKRKSNAQIATCPTCGKEFTGWTANTGLASHRRISHGYRKGDDALPIVKINGAPAPIEIITLGITGIAGPQAYLNKAIEEIDSRAAYLSEQLTGMNAMQAELHALGAQRRLLAETLAKLADTPPLQVAEVSEKTLDFAAKTL